MTRKKTAILAAATVALAAGWFLTPPAAASNAIAELEGLACTSCHDKPGSKLLTDRGKYYELMGSFDGLDQLEESFGRCTTCHVRKPGSLKLTKKGKRFQWMFEDMHGLKAFLLERHPQPAEEGEAPEAADDPAAEGDSAEDP